LDKTVADVELAIGIARDSISQILDLLQTESSQTINARFNLAITILPILFLIVVAAVFLVVSRISSNLKMTVEQMNQTTAGNLHAIDSPVSGKDELAQMSNSAFNMQEQLVAIVSQVLEKASELQASAHALTSHVKQTQDGYHHEEQTLSELKTVYDHLTQGATKVKELGEQVDQQSSLADMASQKGTQLTSQTSQALTVLDDTVASSMQAVNELRESSSAISDILNVIRSIAEQTNLLALNAAIEAARAGEQGRGFAVVADEVRNLAKRTQDSTTEIEALVDALQLTINSVNEKTEASQTEALNVKNMAEQVDVQFSEIRSAIERISETSSGNNELANEQAAAMYQANSSLDNITRQSAERQSQVESLAENAIALNNISNELRDVMKFFKLSG
jgi:methyl-accepting chemotaxis protein